MKYLCAWCDCQLRESTPEQGQTVSHGICAACLARVMNELRGADAAGEVGKHPHQSHRRHSDQRCEKP